MELIRLMWEGIVVYSIPITYTGILNKGTGMTWIVDRHLNRFRMR